MILGEDDPGVIEKFMGFSYDTSKRFFDKFLRYYLDTEDEERIKEVSEKASLIGYSRLIRKMRKKGEVPEKDKDKVTRCLEKISDVINRLDTLTY